MGNVAELRSQGTSHDAERSRLPYVLNGLSLLIGFALLEVALWSPRKPQLVLGLTAIGWMIVSTLVQRTPASRLGFAPKKISDGFGFVLLVVIGCAVAVFATGALNRIDAPIGAVAGRSIGYVIWAFVQEFMLLSFFTVGFERMLSPEWAARCATITFAVAHLPNPWLTGATMIAGYFFTRWFLLHRNLYPIAIAHAVLGLTFALVVPAHLHHNMRVGWGYSRYQRPATVTRVSHPVLADTRGFASAVRLQGSSGRE